MSTDEEAAIIGRMFIERRELHGRETAVRDELRRIAKGLKILSMTVENSTSQRQDSDPLDKPLTEEQLQLLDAKKIQDLFQELLTVQARLKELHEGLNKAGA